MKCGWRREEKGRTGTKRGKALYTTVAVIRLMMDGHAARQTGCSWNVERDWLPRPVPEEGEQAAAGRNGSKGKQADRRGGQWERDGTGKGQEAIVLRWGCLIEGWVSKGCLAGPTIQHLSSWPVGANRCGMLALPGCGGLMDVMDWV